MPIRILIVDDEPPARRKLKGFLADHQDMAVIGEAGNGVEALQAIRRHKPDLVFLDIQMPEVSGLEMLRQLEAAERPLIVFVTAYDQYAVEAFEVHAIDYLLKPFDRQRLEVALDHVRTLVSGPSRDAFGDRIGQLLEKLQPASSYLKRVMARSRNRVVFLKTEEIDWIESAANYAEVHVGKKAYLLRETLNHLEERLDPASFVRIHRQRIVNLDRVAEIHPWSKNDFVVVLTDGTRLKMSRRYRDRLEGA